MKDKRNFKDIEDLKEHLTKLSGRSGTGVQAAIAKRLKVTKATVSGWWSGSRGPSTEAYFKMADASDDPAEQMWYLRKAGFKVSDRMLGALELLRAQEEAAVLVRPVIDTLRRKIPVPRSFVPNPRSSAYFTLTAECADDPFFEGQVVIVDSSENMGRKLAPYWDQLVLLRVDPLRVGEEERGPFTIQGYRIGVVSFRQDHDRKEGATQLVPVLEAINRPDRCAAIGRIWRRLHGEEFSGYKIGSDIQAALQEMEVFKSVSIEGRVIAWFMPGKLPTDLR